MNIVFSGDEENTLIMIRNGTVSAGALSSEDYDQLSPELQSEFVILAETITVPRKFASIRQGFDPVLLKQLHQVLLAISDEDRTRMLSENGWSWKFIPLDEQSQVGIRNITEMIKHTESYKDELSR